jgi:hypothetical protein
MLIVASFSHSEPQKSAFYYVGASAISCLRRDHTRFVGIMDLWEDSLSRLKDMIFS